MYPHPDIASTVPGTVATVLLYSGTVQYSGPGTGYSTVLYSTVQYCRLRISTINYCEITFREFGSDRIQYSKLLEMMTSSNFKYLTIHVMTIRKPRTVILTLPSSFLY